MVRSKFLRRLLFTIISIVTFHILGIETLLIFVIDPPFKEIFLMLLYPLPIAFILVLLYCLLTIFYFCRPILKFANADDNEDEIDEELIKAALNRSVNLQYWLAGLSFPAYMAGGGFGAWFVGNILDWPSHILHLRSFSGNCCRTVDHANFHLRISMGNKANFKARDGDK